MPDAIKQAIEYIDSVPDDRGNAGHIDRDKPVAALRAQPAIKNDAVLQALEKCKKVVIESGAHESFQAVREAFAELRAAITAPQPAEPFKKLSDSEVFWLAETHGINVLSCNALAFYADLISTTPAQPDPLEIIRKDVRAAGYACGSIETPTDVFREIAWQVREQAQPVSLHLNEDLNRDMMAASLVLPADMSRATGRELAGPEPASGIELIKWWARAKARLRYIEVDAMLEARKL